MKHLSFLVAALGTFVLALAMPAAVHSAPPSNDNFADASEISTIPFSAAIDLTEATAEAGEPMGCASHLGDVWFQMPIRPAQTVYRITLTSPGTQLWGAVYRDTGSGITGLQMVIGCVYLGQATNVTIGAAESFYVRVARGYYATATTARLDIEEIAAPENDNFADAMSISSLPFEHEVATAGASTELGEPALCTPPYSEKTVWYSYTPSARHSVTARFTGGTAPGGIAVYVGSSVEALTTLGCQYGFPITINVVAGATYYFQVGGFGQYGPLLRFSLDYGPPDATPPVITAPPVVVDATTPAGATVSYTVTATDEVDGPVPVTCLPPAGSLFAIGDTPVACTAEDAAGSVAEASFNVHIKSAAEQIVDLMGDWSAFMLQRALQALSVNNRPAACAALGTYIRQVQQMMRPPKPKLAPADGLHMIGDARRIRTVIGC